MIYKSSAFSAPVFAHTPYNSNVSTGLPSIDPRSVTPGRRDPGPAAGSERFAPSGSGRGVLPESPAIGYPLGD